MSRATEYTDENIQIGFDVEHIRRRPGMYIGSTQVDGLHHMLFEIVAASVAECRAQYASQVAITLHPDRSLEVFDDATVSVPRNRKGGIIWDISHRHIVTEPWNLTSYYIVRSLSEWSRIEVQSNRRIAIHEFRQGVPVEAPVDGGETTDTGFSIRFRPDPDIFPDPRFDPARIRERLRQFAFLNSGVPITLTTEHGVERFEYTNGIRGYLEFLAAGRTLLHEEPLIARGEADGVEYEVGLQWCDGNDPPMIVSFANGSVTQDGGTHIEGLRAGISRAAGHYLRTHKPEIDFKSEDYREGLIGVVSIHLATPRYEGSTKRKLGSAEVTRPIQRAVDAALDGFFERSPAVVEAIILAAQTRIAAKEARRSRRPKKEQA